MFRIKLIMFSGLEINLAFYNFQIINITNKYITRITITLNVYFYIENVSHKLFKISIAHKW